MKSRTIKDNVTESYVPPETVRADPSPQKVISEHETEDNDSAIGTSSMKSNPAMSANNHTTDQQKSSPIPLPVGPPEHVRPGTVCATESEMRRRHELRYPSLQSSPFLQDCVRRHTPSALPTETKKLNVFERLSAPAPISYKPTARERTRARLSLSLSLGNARHDTLAFGQRREPGTRRDSLRSAFPTVLRAQREPEHKTIPLKRENTKIHLQNHKPSVHKQINNSHTKKLQENTVPATKLPPPIADSASEKSTSERKLHTSRQFEITPMGYDSRYAALKYDTPSPYPGDFEECELIQESRRKCQLWLAHQVALLTGS